jgi:hypothetical protein
MTSRPLPPGMISLADAAARVVQAVSDDFYGTQEFAAGPLTFSAWLDLLDAEVVRITSLQGGVGLGREDFADWSFAEAFEDGLEPDQAARDMLAADVTGAGFLELAGLDGDF